MKKIALGSAIILLGILLELTIVIFRIYGENSNGRN